MMLAVLNNGLRGSKSTFSYFPVTVTDTLGRHGGLGPMQGQVRIGYRIL
jgi:hypothetical protein